MTKLKLQELAQDEFDYAMDKFWDNVNESNEVQELTETDREDLFELIAEMLKK